MLIYQINLHKKYLYIYIYALCSLTDKNANNKTRTSVFRVLLCDHRTPPSIFDKNKTYRGGYFPPFSEAFLG